MEIIPIDCRNFFVVPEGWEWMDKRGVDMYKAGKIGKSWFSGLNSFQDSWGDTVLSGLLRISFLIYESSMRDLRWNCIIQLSWKSGDQKKMLNFVQ